MVDSGDRAFANFLANWAHDKPETFRAYKDDIESIAEPLDVYFKQSGASLPPWVIALGLALMSTGTRFLLAKQLRDKNIENEKYVRDNQRLKRENEQVNRELDTLRKANELRELKKTT